MPVKKAAPAKKAAAKSPVKSAWRPVAAPPPAAPPELPTSARKANRAALEGMGVDNLCDRLRAGETLTGIAKDIGLKSVGTLLQWIGADPERSVRAREARSAASAMYDEQAQQAILDAKDQLGLAKARELAHHLRWRASKVDPSNYGDKVQVDNTHSVKTLTDQDLLGKLAALGVAIPSVMPSEGGEGGNA